MPVFPPVALLDDFNRAEEHPLNNGGKWAKLGESGSEAFVDTENHFHVSQPGAGGEPSAETAFYWTPTKWESEPGVAALLGSNTGRPQTLWACLQNPATEATGYELFAETAGGPVISELKLFKYVKSVRTVLTTKAVSIPFTAFTDQFGLSVQEGKVIAWFKKGAEAWKAELEAADVTYTSGYSGAGGAGTSTNLDNFEGGEVAAGPPTVENPGTQHGRVGKKASLQIKAKGVTKYFAVKLPKGLTINESTGLITGLFEEAESPKVKISVENAKAETAETTFEWIVTEGGTNITGMIVG